MGHSLVLTNLGIKRMQHGSEKTTRRGRNFVDNEKSENSDT